MIKGDRLLKIKAIRIKGKDLKPGELFSTAGPLYWSRRDPMAIGEKVYIRTDAPFGKDQEEQTVFKIEVLS